MGGLTDSQNRAVDYLPFDLTAGEQSTAIQLNVTPLANSKFVSESDGFLSLKARVAGSGNPYVDLAAGIDLSGFTPGVAVLFDVVAVADPDLTGRRRRLLWLGVTTSDGAGWRS